MSDNGSVGPTPGPWSLGRRSKYRVRIDGDGWIELASVVVAMTGDGGGRVSSPDGEANARLIAAAPELAEAAEDAFVFLGSVDGASELRAKLMAALQKAGLSAGEGC